MKTLITLIVAVSLFGCANHGDRFDAANAEFHRGNAAMAEPPLLDRIVADPAFEASAKRERGEADQALTNAGHAIADRSPLSDPLMLEAEQEVVEFIETLGLEPQITPAE